MAEQMQAVGDYLRRHADRNTEDLKRFLRIPSVSADSRHRDDVKRAAEFVRDQLAGSGLTAELIPTQGHPLVYAEWLGRPDGPTALVYGHYDVQPPDPLKEWVSPPFEPEERDGCLYARGATDDKGQMLTHVKSVQAWLEETGSLPMNVKFLIEGEEEVGSDNLETFLKQNQERCACDVAVISDTAQYGPKMPAITYGLRGIMACEITLQGPRQDLHSGVFGGSIANPANALAELIASLQDEQGRIQVPGFYDDVLPLTDQERADFAALPFNKAEYLSGIGAKATWGEDGYSTLERRWARPTCDVNGMVSGYTGEGPKTIVPATATAKVSFRLVPDQDAAALIQSVEAFLRERCRPGLKMTFTSWHGCPGVLCDRDSRFMQAARRAIEHGFGQAPVMIREGGSIPVVASFKEQLGVDTLLLGWGQNTDNLHSPNEHFSVKAYHQGIAASAWLWQELASS